MAQSFSSAAVGSYTFPFDPVVDTPRKIKSVDSTATWSSSQIKDDGFLSEHYGLVGLHVELTWEIMAGVFFDKLQRFYEEGGAVTWDAQERARSAGEQYDVRIMDLDFDNDHRLADHDYVFGVKLLLNIRGTV